MKTLSPQFLDFAIEPLNRATHSPSPSKGLEVRWNLLYGKSSPSLTLAHTLAVPFIPGRRPGLFVSDPFARAHTLTWSITLAAMLGILGRLACPPG